MATIIGSNVNDILAVGSGDDTLDGGAGSDTYIFSGTGGGFDTFLDSGTSGTDTILAATDGTRIGLKSFSSRAGIEVISAGGKANVTIAGDGGANVLDFSTTTLSGIAAINGGAGNDTITGSAGIDTLIGGNGNDLLNGGGGGDRYLVSGTNDGFDTYRDTGTSGTDTILAGADGTRIGLQSFRTTDGIEQISANSYANVTIAGDGGANVLDFSATTLTGITVIDGGAGNDTITGSAGIDTLIGGNGNDLLNGGGGGDSYLVNGTNDGFDTYRDTGTSGTDTILAGSDGTRIGLQSFRTTDGIEQISANSYANVTIAGDGGANVLDFSATTLVGIAAISGGAGNDTLIGSAGADTLIGGDGNDLLRGGGGVDTAVYAGARSDYAVTETTTGLSVRALTGSDGTDLLVSVERLSFADGTYVYTPGVGLHPQVTKPELEVGPVSGLEDGAILLNITAQAADPSRALSLTLTGLPAGAILSAGVQNPDGSWKVSGDQLPGLALVPPKDYSGSFTLSALASDGAASRSGTFTVDVAAVADSAIVSAASVAGKEDAAIALKLAARLADSDGSEVLGVTLSGLPADASLNAGTRNADGSWTLPPDHLDGLTVTPPKNFSGTMTLTVTTTTTELSNGSVASKAATFSVAVAAVADAPILTVAPTSGVQGKPIALSIAAALTDTDGSEALSTTISGLPQGSVLSAGTVNADNTWTVSPSQLKGLTVTPPATFFGQLHLIVSASSTEQSNRSTASITTDLLVSVLPSVVTTGSTPAVLSAAPADGREDVRVPLNLSAHLPTNATGVLGIRIEGLPAGASLSAGTANADGSWTLAPTQLKGLSLISPHDYAGTMDLVLATTTTKANGELSTARLRFEVDVEAVADAPAIRVSDSSGKAGAPIGLLVGSALTDTDGSETLSVTLSGVPDRAVLSSGTHNEDGTWTLTSAQLSNLKMTPPSDFVGTAHLTVTAVATESSNGSTATSVGTITVTVGPAAVTTAPSSGNGSPTTGGSSTPNVVINPQVIEAHGSGDVVGFQLKNTTDHTAAAHFMSFGQPFVEGNVMPGDVLYARINGVEIPVQMDVKATNDDGSVRNAILTLKTPDIAANGSLDMVLTKGDAHAQASSIGAKDILAHGLDLKVTLDIHNADGTLTPHTFDAAQALQQAMTSGTLSTWMSGPQATEYRVNVPVGNGLTVTFDIRGYADGTNTTDVIVANDTTYTKGVGAFDYDYAIIRNGTKIASENNFHHNQNATWHQEVWSNGAPDQYLVRDVQYLVESGAIPAYDTTVGVSSSAISASAAKLNDSNTGLMDPGAVQQYMGTPGGRPDIGPETTWAARALLSQDPTAMKVLFENADAAGSIPWHFRDEATGAPVRIDDHPLLWLDGRGTGKAYGSDQLPEAFSQANTGWTVDASHRPSLTYVPYLLTGSHYYADELAFQASSTIAFYAPGNWRDLDGNLTFKAEERASAWTLRDLSDAAYVLPDDYALKEYFTSLTGSNLHNFIETYVTGGAMDKFGEIEGFTTDYNFHQKGLISPWQQDYLAITLGYMAQRGYAEAGQALAWMDNFISGRFTHADEGFDPLLGSLTSPYLTVVDPVSGQPLTTWAEVYNATMATMTHTVTGQEGYPDWAGGAAAVAKASLASIISATGSTQSIEAYGYLAGMTAKMGSDYVNDPTWAITPKLSDGQYLRNDDIHVVTSSADTVLKGSNSDQLLHGGSGNDKITGGTGIDLLFGGNGNDILDGVSGNDYLFGNAGDDRLIAGKGNEFLKGGTGSDTFVFTENVAGHHTVADFTIGQDHLEVHQTAGGVASVSALLAGATADTNDNAVLHLSHDLEITLLGVHIGQMSTADIRWMG
ncbi:calcium-binding protein [Magnetospirillum molischianum]|uniref:Uncharacterized protein n=1 Tax=Magnetospirillum molischianum DSM 120 TaxID=1150626 RepID=H8FQ97_MAGML|nr:calcium-binding protein [Magnetospirillum molischianum]CCG40535.1 hypothetical protein PHAMO_210046 [Magnetospirillum molischianum DSM 120]